MGAPTPLVPLWLSYQDRIDVVRSIANLMESDTSLTHESRTLLKSVQSELSVAAARDSGAKISFARLRKAIGQEDSSVPVKLSVVEKQALLDHLDLPIDLKRKLLA